MKPHTRHTILALASWLLASTLTEVRAEPRAAGETPAQRSARMAWWNEARFGMFVHWGIHILRIKPDSKHWKPVNLRQVQLLLQ